MDEPDHSEVKTHTQSYTSGDDNWRHEALSSRLNSSGTSFSPYINESLSPDFDSASSLKQSASDFSTGFKSKIKAPLIGLEQITSSLDLSSPFFTSAQAGDRSSLSNKTSSIQPKREIEEPATGNNASQARLAGEMAGNATLLLMSTALTRQFSGTKMVQEFAPIASGAILGALEPTSPGDNTRARLASGAQGALSVALFTHGGKALNSIGFLKTENTLAAPLISGALVGATSEETNSLIRYGHFADPQRVLTAAASTGLTSALFHGVGQSAGKSIASLEKYSQTQDRLSLRTSYPFVKDASTSNEPWHLVLGSGGSKAALTGTGVVLACKHAGLELGSVGGVSGGAIPAAMAASDMTSKEILKFAYETEIHKLVSRKHLLQEFISAPNGQLKPLQTGLYETSQLGAATNKIVPSWPTRFWTMAVDHKNEIVMTKNGIVEYAENGQKQLLSQKPISVGDAVRATSAIPGVFEAVEIEGRHVFDGALGKFGKCPTNIAVEHLGIDKNRIIASLPEGAMAPTERFLYNTVRFLSGSFRQNSIASEAGIVLRPRVNNFDGLRFNLTPELKEEAILEGYRNTISSLAKRKIVTGEKLQELYHTGESFENLKAAVNWD